MSAEAYGASMFGGVPRYLPARTRTRLELRVPRVTNPPRACTLGAKMQTSDDFETNAMVVAARRGDVAVCALMCVHTIYKFINKQLHTEVNPTQQTDTQ